MVKLPWYLAQGCREVLIIDRDTLAVELYGVDGRIEPARSDVLGCTFSTVDGPAVQVSGRRRSGRPPRLTSDLHAGASV